MIYTTYRRKKYLAGRTREQYWAAKDPYFHIIDMPDDSTVDDTIIACASSGIFGLSPSTTTQGAFECHGPHGIWWHEKGIRNLHTSPRGRQFTSYEDLEGGFDILNPFSTAVREHYASTQPGNIAT